MQMKRRFYFKRWVLSMTAQLALPLLVTRPQARGR
jgi:hypothetical protein